MPHIERIVRAIAVKHEVVKAEVGINDNPLYRHVSLTAAKPVQDAEKLARTIHVALRRRGFREPEVGKFSDGVWWVSAKLPYAANPDKPEGAILGSWSGPIDQFIHYAVHVKPNSRAISVFAKNPENKGQRQDLDFFKPVPIVVISPEKLAKAINVKRRSS